ncbi:MAG: ATP-binding protein [bacterium]
MNNIPGYLRYKKAKNEKSPVWFIDCRNTDFSPTSSLWHTKINKEITGTLNEIHTPYWEEPILIKCHVGEKKCSTRMLPHFALSTISHFKSRGMKRIVAGDSTVAYSGDRGYKENNAQCTRYMSLARTHGWSEEGPLGIPFVVLDRPMTSVEGTFSFKDEEIAFMTHNAKRFREVYLAGGFAAAGTIVNHIHLTLHDMAQLAGAVKGITMGGSSRKGKLVMHQCYSPHIHEKLCTRCGTCASKCPEEALMWNEGEVPQLLEEKCIGCGECLAVCKGKHISMCAHEVEDWLRGSLTLPYRMADYMMGMMEGRWERLLNIMHMYTITRCCDCLDKEQKSLIYSLGFLVGRNPFAVDLMATYLMHEEIYTRVQEGTICADKDLDKTEILKIFFPHYHGLMPYRHIQDEYAIVVEPEPIQVTMS